jgi:oligopeptide/dipeptide ABC transporter ATP-binding protein
MAELSGGQASPAAGVPAVSVEGLRVEFAAGRTLGRGRGHLTAVDGVTLQIAKGETLGLVGESGCGKTTLGQAILRLTPSTGTIRIDGRDITGLGRRELRRMRRHMQVIFQDPYTSLDPRQRLSDILAEPLRLHRIVPARQRAARVAELLDMVGLRADQAGRYPHQLSGGQRQRVAVARALAVEPAFIVCDEPLSALDVSVQAQVLNLLVDLRRQLRLTYLFIGHDLAVMRYLSDRIAVMYLGAIVEIGPPEALFQGAAHPYTRGLVSAVPLPDPVGERQRQRVVVSGDLPSPIDPIKGCRFRSRCWLAQQLGSPDICAEQEPPLLPIGPGRHSACHFTADLADSPVGVVAAEGPARRHIPQPVRSPHGA